MSVSDEDLKQTATDPRKLLTQESEKLHWNLNSNRCSNRLCLERRDAS